MNEAAFRLVHTSISALVVGLLLLPSPGCEEDSASSCEGDECGENTAGEGGACEGDECDAAAGAPGTAGAGGAAGESPDGGAGGDGISGGGGDISGVVDLPDDLFEDSNGDGIDGDIEQAVFVSLTGDDAADGTMGAPVRSIGHAVELAASTGKDVYLCDGIYPENVTIEDTAVNLYGGYDCDSDWARGTGRAEIAPEAGIPFTVRNVPSAMLVDRLDFTAPDAPASEPGASSIGVLIVDAGDIEIAHSSIAAGNAAGGAVGAPGADSDVVHSSGIEGPSAPNTLCSDSNPCTAVVEGAAPGANYVAPWCPYSDENTWGGFGGDGGNVAAGGILLDTSDPGEPGGEGQPAGASSGADGAPGEDGAHGEAAPSGFGLVDETGYVPSNTGADGEPGGTGVAGGGGDGGDSDNVYDNMTQLRTGEYYVGGGGGQGGPGGCGGEGGKGGGAGGAAIALLALRSGLALRRCDLAAGSGGNGSRGGEGGEGSAGGAGGPGGWCSVRSGLERLQAQSGGTGGPGGRGGIGGPGGGGPSIALVVAGDEPALDSVNLSFASGGQGGVRGEPTARAANGEAMQMKVIAP